MNGQVQCPICQKGGIYRRPVEQLPDWGLYMCGTCGYYYHHAMCTDTYLAPKNRAEWQPDRLAALLKERDNKQLPRPILQFSDEEAPAIADGVPLRVRDLLSQWPQTVGERIDRAFCNIVNRSKRREPIVGENVRVEEHGDNDLVFLTTIPLEQQFLLKAMFDYGWVERLADGEGVRHVRVTPSGWAHYEELNRGRGNAKNPAFVAMRFGGEADKLYKDTIEPAVRAAGYDVMRGDTPEHNESIMDRVLDDIRRAPFVVAEITGNNAGVYYEAGFARGLGTEVIYCFDRAEKIPPHFDVLAINQVRYDSPADLGKRLDNRIRGSIGRGPHLPDGGREHVGPTGGVQDS